MKTSDETTAPLEKSTDPLLWIAIIILLTVAIPWLILTPPGLMGKADAVGYAVCHRIAERSFTLPGDRQLPMCARDTGTFVGVFVALLVPGLMFKRRRASAFPPLGILAVMLAMSFIWAFDGTNSFMHLLPRLRLPRLYSPSNFLRVVTGTFHGITLGSLILPIINSSLWADYTNEQTVSSWKELLIMYGMGIAIIAMSLSDIAIFLYPIGILSALGVMTMLTGINTVLVATLIRRDAQSRTWRDALPLLLLGLAVSLMIVGGIEAGRYALFGTWDGFSLSDFR